MAELTYNDAYRAAHDATKDIRDMLGRVIHQSDRFNELHSQLVTMQRSIDDARRSIITLSANMHPAQRAQPHHQSGTAAIPHLDHLLQSTQRIEVRLQQMESYLHDVSEYFNVLRQQQLAQLESKTPKRQPRNTQQRRAA